MADFSSMTSEEIAGALWDAQKNVIAEESLYYGAEGRQKFIDEYSGSFSTWEGSGEQVVSEMQLEMGDMQLGQLEFAVGDFEQTERANIEMEEKWWEDTGWIDEETGEYQESKKEMLGRHKQVTDELSEDEKTSKISSAVANYTKTKESLQFDQIKKGVRDPKFTDRIKEELWSTVSDIKSNFSDEKENRELTLERTVRDNKKNIDRGYETVEAGVSGKELQIEHAIQDKDITEIVNKEAAISSWGGKLWDTIRRIQDTGIFDAPEVKLNPEAGKEMGGNWWGKNWSKDEHWAGFACVVSTALNTTGAWSDSQKDDAVQWCQDTHHDGTKRGKTWIKGYHIWGKFLSKWVKRSSIVRYVVDVTTDAFIDVTRRGKVNYLGYIIHYGWINPLSYIIGIAKNNKKIGMVIIPAIIALYIVLFPVFGLISIPYMIKRRKI